MTARATATAADRQAAAAGADRYRPVFLGGAGYSGASLIGLMLDRHAALSLTRPAELSVLTDPGGVLDALRLGEALLAADRGPRWKFWRRTSSAQAPAVGEDRTPPEEAVAWASAQRHEQGHEHGLASIDDPSWARITAQYLNTFWASPQDATREFAAAIGSAAAQDSAVRWVDASRLSALRAPFIARVLPQARIVNVLRDGRDVAAELLDAGVLPGTKPSSAWHRRAFVWGLDEWERRVSAADGGMRRAPVQATLNLRAADLAAPGGEAAYAGLLGFLGIDDDPAMHEFWRTRMTVDALVRPRWQDVVPAAEQADVTARYTAMLAQMADLGIATP